MHVTWQETYQNFKSDLKRRLLMEEKSVTVGAALTILLKPGVLTVMCYRLSRFCFYHRLTVVCKLISLFLQVLNTSEISPEAEIGPGLVIAGLGAVGIPGMVVLGRDCTFMGLNSFTLGAMEHEQGADDRIRVGDYCVFGVYTRVMRPVKLANSTQIKSGSVVIASVKKPGQTISGVPAKRKVQHEAHFIQQWNPLKGRWLEGDQQ